MGSIKAEPVAIIGTSCRLPGANSPSKLWELLKNPVDLLTDIPQSRFNPAAFFHENAEHPGTANVTKAYLLEDDPLTFDNDFFGISPREAESMDPQQRILLEIVYEAIESAGYSISQLMGSSTGVFVGQMSDDYRDLIMRDIDCHPQHSGTGIARSILANRVSYAFDWRGPSVNVDTACSSSLVALHQAVQSLRNEECDMAVVAGVNLVFSPELFSVLSSLRMLSPTGRSRMWDINADGYARGEGFTAIVIKTLGRALADADDIESVIRNTGVNQDGRSAGLTVPNAAAQAELIKATYTRCGLDYLTEEGGCQYFEAHGTGTSAGDPKEAESIHMTFFSNNQPNGCKIYVGSIKTVIGHTEGTAGLASVLKASQAVKYGLIPPNLHFQQLNPDIKPYYNGLEVPISLKPWPTLPPGLSRRASVNSFGFGGTNAHIIIENWDNESACAVKDSISLCWGPFVLSANSKTSLEAAIASLSKFVEREESIDLSRLAWTLQTRRTSFKHRIAFSATTREELVDRLQSAIGKKEDSSATTAAEVSHAHILGIFTGQGTQWATMGASLYHHSAAFRDSFKRLDSVLRTVPSPPSWSLASELLRLDDPARIASAEISQPLCTALQIALVDLLRECGVTFSAVVGHSSGEIAAAYAAGVLEAGDAILIAYYRGLHSSQCASSNQGKMMAVGMSAVDAEAFCRRPQFSGRMIVAAKNSNSSCTVSGDARAIEEAEKTLKDKSLFARILKTDVAYHSHHMQSVRGPYLASMKQSNIQPRRNCFAGNCNWYSSVYDSGQDRKLTTAAPFESTYWADNLTNPVLFANAIASALQEESFDLVLEIGPHPALRAPALETIREVSGHALPYQGLLERNKDAIDTFSSALGLIWSSISSSTSPIDFAGFRKTCDGPNWTEPRVLKDLPPYQWDHGRQMLKESRKSKAWRSRVTPCHELLGIQISSGEKEYRWRNVLRLSDLDWLQGHQFQNQVLFPASGYLTMAIQAALQLFGADQEVQLVELQDVVIHNGITLEEGSPGVDMEFAIRALDGDDDMEKLAEFSCRCQNADAAAPEFDKEVVTGRVLVIQGPPDENALPHRVVPVLPMTEVSIDRFYTWMEKIGLRYSEPFRLDTIQRRLNLATVTTAHTVSDSYKIHPATLDTILQGLYAAFSYPGDGRVWTTYLPKSFHRVRFNINSCRQTRNGEQSELVAHCCLISSSARTICGDIDVFCAADGHAEIQAEGVVLSSLEVPTDLNDRSMFWKTVLKQELLPTFDVDEETDVQLSPARDGDLYEICERTAYFYLRKFLREVKHEEIPTAEWHFQYLMGWARNSVDLGSQGERHPLWQASWDNMTQESIDELKQSQHNGQIDLELLHHLGPRLPAIVRGTEPALQVLKTDGMIDKLYSEGFGVPETNHRLGTTLDHLAHKHPRLRILEIGAGTGGSTAIALNHLGDRFEEYTFTDISPAYFPAAQARFTAHEALMRFRTLDIESAPAEQGFEPQSYDVVVAAHVLHATRSIAQTLRHCRALLRPGGYLILLEITNPDLLRIPFLFACLPGWWLGHGDGRSARPTLTETEWDTALSRSSFSGVDRAFRDTRDGEGSSTHSFSVIVSQALDDQVGALREPLSLARGVAHLVRVLIIGGSTLNVSKVATRIKSVLGPFAEDITVVNSLEEVSESGLQYGSAVVCLCELEKATFKRMDPQSVLAMQLVFREAKYVLWATRGSRDSDPYANITLGIGRSASRELAHLRLKFVDFDAFPLRKTDANAVLLSEMLLRMVCLDLRGFERVLWPKETEVVVEDGVVLIPRVVPDDELNDRFNSSRREITRNVAPLLQPVEVVIRDDRLVIEEMKDDAMSKSSSRVNVLSSSLFCFTCSDASRPCYICIAYSTESKQRVLTVSDINSSVTTATPGYTFPCDENTKADDALSLVLLALICHSLASDCDGTVWIHNAEDGVSERIFAIAAQKNVPLFSTSSDAASRMVSSGRTTYIHPRTAQRDIRSLVPPNTRRFVDMGAQLNSNIATFAISMQIGSQPGLYQGRLSQPFRLNYSKSRLREILRKCSAQLDRLHNPRNLVKRQIIEADQLHERLETSMSIEVISWTSAQSIRVQIKPPSQTRLFDGQKTYFLIGLTGDLGLSLCDWMADHGVKFLAIASRKPVVSPAMIARLQRKGVSVGIFSLDVADKESLENVRREIVSTMPPIAGVANAALAIRDHPFDGMSFEDLEAVFKPKVVGTQNLDRLFYSTPLDFFILFSSIASIVGKPAQSSYNAANLFMSTIAAKRRKRGLAASVMHFGMLLGVGFIHGQAGPTVEARFRHDDLPAIPESDFHEIFAQAIISGRPDSGLSPEVIAGLGTEIDTPWRAMPRFGHCRIKSDRKGARYETRGPEQSNQTIQDQLQLADDSSQALVILKAALSRRVGMAICSSSEDVDENVGLISLGLDSLVAVEVRSWLLKILEVDVPVLKFLSGSSLRSICHDILNKLPSSLRPWDGGYDNRSEAATAITLDSSTSTRIPEGEPLANDPDAVWALTSTNLDEHQVLGPVREVNESGYVSNQTAKQSQPNSKYERVGAMSHSQSQLYFLHEYLRANAYNVAYYGKFYGQLDIEHLRKALWVVGKRHEAMRSAYMMDIATARPVQAVLSEPRILLESRMAYDQSEMQAEVDGVKDYKFEIEKGIVMRVVVISHAPSLHSILFSHHHIALDGISWSVFVADLAKAYSGGLRSMPPAPGALQSIDMAQQHLETLTRENLHSDLIFWKNKYKTIPEPLPLFPFAKLKMRPAVKDYSINTSEVKLPGTITKLVEKTAAKIGVTSFHFYLATFAAFLSRCLGVEDVAIGIVDANRTEQAHMNSIGYFLNMLPARIQLDHSESFDVIARHSRDVALAAISHSRAPIDMVIGELELSRSANHHPLFQVAVNYRRAPLNETDFGSDGKIHWDGAVPGGNPYDLFLNVAATADWTYVSLITQQSLYEATDGALMLKWYTRALEAFAYNSSCHISECSLSNDTDIAEALDLGRGDEVDLLWKGTLTDRLDKVMAGSPDDIAIKDDEGKILTYAQTKARIIQIARGLRAVSPSLACESYVGMLVEPVADAVCCILAILRLGLVWIPLDTRNHHRRLRTVVEESRPRVLLCHGGTQQLAKQVAGDIQSTQIISIDDMPNNDVAEEETPPPIQDTQPAMLLYTSGSTGAPKGVLLTYSGLMNQIYGTIKTFDLSRETTLQQSPLGFDLMLDQIFLALCNGGTIIIVGKAGRGDPTHMAELMVRNNVTLTHFVPSEYLALLNYGHHILSGATSWRYAMSGGEKLGQELRLAFGKLKADCTDGDLKLINVYGPAEITLACARGFVPFHELSSGKSSKDYLRASPNYGLEIADSALNVLPVGMPGEICITGRGVGLGYLNRPEDSSRKFTRRGTLRIYRSGDYGRLLPDGTIQVFGRLDGDSQVKINGFRVELDEIANTIVHQSHGRLVNAAASWRPGQPSGVLVAFVVFMTGLAGDYESRLEFLRQLRSNLPLPSFMRPRFIIPIDRIPASANGKTDRRALDLLRIPDPLEPEINGRATRSLTQWELATKQIWEDVLLDHTAHKTPVIHPNSDFFDIGGTSILIIKLRSLFETQFSVKLPMPALFHSSTLSSMAALLGATSTESTLDTEPTVLKPWPSFLEPRGGAQKPTDWDLEIAGLTDGLLRSTPASPPRTDRPRTQLRKTSGEVDGLEIVLTGATGFIGRHILARLIYEPKVRRIHCIAIRPPSSGIVNDAVLSERLLPNKSEKIVAYPGDLADRTLGLSEEQLQRLVDHADAIVHNGADVSLLKTYRTLRRANVLSTQTLIAEIAAPRHLPMHYVSTASVAKVVPPRFQPLGEGPAYPPSRTLLDAVDGYAATKWMSETLLDRCAGTIPGYVHRLAHVAGSDASELDAIGMLTKYAASLHALPRIDAADVEGAWDFVPIGDVARDIVASVLASVTDDALRQPQTDNNNIAEGKEKGGGGGAIFINHCNDVKVGHEDLRSYLETEARKANNSGGQGKKQGDDTFVEVSMREWLDGCRALGMHPLVHDFYLAFSEGRGKMVLPVIVRGRSPLGDGFITWAS